MHEVSAVAAKNTLSHYELLAKISSWVCMSRLQRFAVISDPEVVFWLFWGFAINRKTLDGSGLYFAELKLD